MQGQYPEFRGHGVDPNVTGLFSTRWNVGDGEMRLLVTGSYEDYGARTEQIGSNGWAQIGMASIQDGTVTTYLNFPTFPVYRPNVFRIQQFDFSRQRIGLDGSFQWKPTSDLTFTLS